MEKSLRNSRLSLGAAVWFVALSSHLALAQDVIIVDTSGKAIGTLKDRQAFRVRVAPLNRFRYRIKVDVKGKLLFSEKPDVFKDFGIAKAEDKSKAATGPGAETRRVNLAAVTSLPTVADITGVLDVLTQPKTQFVTLVRGARDEADAKQRAGSVKEILSNTLLAASAYEKFSFNQSMFAASDDVGALAARLGSLAKTAFDAAQRRLSALQAALDAAGADATLRETAPVNEDIATLKAVLAKRPAYMQGLNEAADLALHASLADYMQVEQGGFQASGDQVDITVTTVLLKEDGTDEKDESTLTRSVDVTSGSKIDFSTGPIFAGLDDFKYTAVPDVGSNPQTYHVDTANISRENGSVALAGMAHFYFRNTADYRMGLTFAVAAKDKPIYGIGFSLLLGRQQRFVITAGLAFGKVTRLDGPGTGLSSTTVPTHDVYISRPFVGLSYQF